MKNSIPANENELDYLYKETKGYFGTPEYQAYVELVHEIVGKSKKRGLSYGELRRKLGSKLKERWTADVMDTLQPVGTELTRYRLPQPVEVKVYTRREMQLKWNLGPLVPRAERF